MALLEGRFLYDAFVIGTKADGIYAAIATSGQQAAPSASYSAASKTLTLTSANASAIKYTTDDTDPRYSSSAKSIATGGTVDLSGFAGSTATVKSVAQSATLFTSNVTTTTQAVSA